MSNEFDVAEQDFNSYRRRRTAYEKRIYRLGTGITAGWF